MGPSPGARAPPAWLAFALALLTLVVVAGQGPPPSSTLGGWLEAASVPAGGREAALQVWTAEGPGGGAPRPLSPHFFGFNLWDDHGWWPQRDPTWYAMLDALRPGALRWPAGHPSQEYCFETPEGQAWEGCHGWTLRRAQVRAFVNLSRDLGAEPLVALNVKGGTPDMAAAMVHWAKQEGLGVRWWEFGNEPDLGYKIGAARHFLRDQYPAFAGAVRSVDPEAKLVGPELMTGVHVTGSHGRPDLMREFLEANGQRVDAISWHLYPLDSENPQETSPARPGAHTLLQWRAPDWEPSGVAFVEEATAKLARDRDRYAPGAELWVTELGPDSGEPGAKGITDAQVAAVWFADVLGRFAAAGTHATFQFAYDHWSPDQDELSLVRRPPWGQHDPLPPWYAYWLYAQQGDVHVLRTNSSDDARVGVHAFLREDGRVAVVMVNKAAEERDARWFLHDARPVLATEVWRLTAPSPWSLEATVNGRALDPERLAAQGDAIPPVGGPAASQAAWTLPPYSVTVAVVTFAS